jgi:PAS domain S-box-containing protein
MALAETFSQQYALRAVVLALVGGQALFIGLLLFARARRKRTNDMLRAAARVFDSTGDAFFRSLTTHLNSIVHADYVSVGELSDCGKRCRTVAVSAEGKNLENLEYELEHTPCKVVLELGRFFDRHDLQAHFPLDAFLIEMGFQSYLGIALMDSAGKRLGVMSVLSKQALKEGEIVEVVLELFATRASAEMERRRSERALQASQARNRAILNAIPDKMFVLDNAGRVVDYSVHDNRELYVPPEQFLNRSVLDVLPADAAEAIVRTIENTTNSTEPTSVEFSMPMADALCFYESRMVRLDEDKVLMIARNVTDRKRTELELEKSREFSERIAQTMPNVFFIYDLLERRNVYVNQRSWEVLGYTAQEVLEMGDQFLPRTMHPEDMATLPKLAEQYAKADDSAVFEHLFRFRHRNGEWRWVHRCATIFRKTPDGRPMQMLGTVTDVTDLKNAEEELKQLSARLVTIQDDERRRIALELHDGTAQNLFAMTLNLGQLVRSELSQRAKKTLIDCQNLCEATLKDIRTLAYLLHPPMLDQRGLAEALRWFIDGFAKRTGVDVRLEVPGGLDRMPMELERDLFRIVQEGLSNIARHSGSTTGEVRLERRNGEIVLQIRDFGRGMSQTDESNESLHELFSGVGIPGMRDRVRQVGGRLEIQSDENGTRIVATVPFESEGSDPPPVRHNAFGSGLH